MSGKAINWALGVLFTATLVGHALVGNDRTQPNYQVLPEMVHSPAYRSYSPNPVFTDGKTMQSPVPGTLARGQERFAYPATPEGAERAGRELTNPLAPPRDTAPRPRDTEVALRGRDRFAVFCAVCHGADGTGGGSLAQRGISPPSFLADRAMKMKDGQMYHVLTLGQSNMPAFAAQLPPEDRWAVVLHVRRLQEAAAREKGGKP